jgi:DNA polymerase alpha subunit A
LAENVLESDGSMRFFFLDAYEVKEKGEVYLFGKVLDRASGRYISCCVLVQNMQRKLFVLPRPRKLDGTSETDIEVEMRMVYEEVDNVRSKRGIRSFRSRTVEKKYAFEVAGVPAESEYLEVAYPFTGGLIASVDKSRSSD